MPSETPLFTIKCTHDEMVAYIPKKTIVSSEIAHLSYVDLCDYLKKLGYLQKPKPESYEELRRLAASTDRTMPVDFPIVRGYPFTPARDAHIKWLAPSGTPKDLVIAKTPFAILYQGRGSQAGQTVFGKTLPLPEGEGEGEEQPVNMITTSTDIHTTPAGELFCDRSGQVLHENGVLKFIPHYEVTNCADDEFKKLIFRCDVIVKCDLDPQVEWTIYGNFTTEQFWLAHNIKVLGNVKALGGIQTNSNHDETKAVMVKGNLEAHFIQSSRFVVEGDVKVDKSISNSHFTIGKNLECVGDPGKIISSEIYIKSGSVFANTVGSDKDVPTLIKFFTEEGAQKSEISEVSEGTRMQIKKANIIVKTTQPWPPEPRK